VIEKEKLAEENAEENNNNMTIYDAFKTIQPEPPKKIPKLSLSSQPRIDTTISKNSYLNRVKFYVLDDWKPTGEMTKRLDNAIMSLIASASLPLSFVDQPALHQLMHMVAPQYQIRFY
jgi:hypothetical protein